MIKIKYKYTLTLFLLLFFIIPLPQYFLVASSFMSGLLGFFVFFIFTYFYFGDFRLEKYAISKIFSLTVFVTLHLLLCSFFFQGADFFRGLLSVVILLFMLLCGYLMNRLIMFSTTDEMLTKIVNICFWFFLVSFALNFVPAIQNANNVKPILPFNEPSHYALFFIPIMYFKAFSCKTRNKILYILVGLLIALLLKNFTLLVAVAIGVVLVYGLKSIVILSISATFLLLYVDLTYFNERLQLTSETDNLSVLVFVQGWQLAYNSFIQTYGFGIGFQQLGYVNVPTEAGNTIIRLLGRNINETDAGLTFGKIVSEFGIFGIIFIFYYLKNFVYLYFKIRNATNKKFIFAASVFFAFSLDLFVRGIGYFNTPFFLFVMSLFMIKYFKKNESNI